VGFLWLGCLHASFPHVPRSLEYQSKLQRSVTLRRATNGKQRQLDMYLEAHWPAKKCFYFTAKFLSFSLVRCCIRANYLY